jgi:hypothetical protein
VSKLIETLAEELERPRDVTQQVSDHIWGNYDIERDAVGDFLDTELTGLEDYQHDLILSPLFTPKLADQALFADLLGQESVPKTEWPALVEQLDGRPTRGLLVTIDKEVHTIALRDVVLERYVHRVRLDGAIPEPIWRLLEQDPFAADLRTFKAIARRATWESDGRRNILETYLASAGHDDLYHAGDSVQLLRVAEDYKPRDLAYLTERIPLWQEAIRQEIDSADEPKPYVSTEVQAHHGFGRDQRKKDDARISAKKKELAFFDRLHQVLMG